jgi:hypothetical protein
MPDPRANKRIVGLVLFGSSAMVVLVAILIGTNVIAVGGEVRPIIIGVLALTAVLDVIMGWRFLSAASE